MRARFLIALLAAAFTVGSLLPAAVAAPGPTTPGPPPAAAIPQPPKQLPNVGGDPTKNLDFLFGALKAAPDEESAKAIEERIWAVWVISRSDTTNLLMTRVRTAVEQQDTDLAIKLLDAVIKIMPDYIEAWNRRATLYFMKKDYSRALADIQDKLGEQAAHRPRGQPVTGDAAPRRRASACPYRRSSPCPSRAARRRDRRTRSCASIRRGCALYEHA